jgi:hypothetical protein
MRPDFESENTQQHLMGNQSQQRGLGAQHLCFSNQVCAPRISKQVRESNDHHEALDGMLSSDRGVQKWASPKLNPKIPASVEYGSVEFGPASRSFDCKAHILTTGAWFNGDGRV